MSNRVLGYGLLVIGAFLAWGSLAWLWHRVQVLETENGGLKTVLTAKMETRKADNGQEMARISIAEVGEETLRRLIKEQTDSLKVTFGEPLKRVQQYQRVQIQTLKSMRLVGENTTKGGGSGGDTLQIKVFHYQDKFTERNDTLIGDTLYSGTDFKNDIQILVRKGKREKWWKFWKNRPLIGEAYSGNPDTEIKGFQILKVIEK